MLIRFTSKVVLFLLVVSSLALAKNKELETTATEEGAEVTVDHRPLFVIQERLGSFTAKERAKAVSERLEKLSRDYSLRLESLQGIDVGPTTDIAAGDLVIMTITEQDAKAAGRPRKDLAQDYVQAIQSAVAQTRKTYSIKSIGLGALFALLCTIGLVLFLRLFSRIFPRIYRKLESWKGTLIHSLRIKTVEIVPAHRITDLLIGLAKTIRLAATVIAAYFYLTTVLSFFPWTKGFSGQLLSYLLTPLSALVHAFVAFLPNVFFIGVISVVTRFVIKLAHLVFAELRRETISFPGFYPEWAHPTYQIVRFLIIAFAAVVMFPYLPGADSPAFKGISVFLGVLFSLGSTSAVANIVSGVILTYMRAFKVGDRVKIADTTGDVIEKSLLVTRVRTIKNEDITIPNAMVLNSHIVNFCACAKEGGLILHTTVTIGYDAPWPKVHELLMNAAKATEGILKEPTPFVLQTSLDDFYVSYELNAYTDRPAVMAKTYSALHQSIQDEFNKGGVEIMSPHYAAIRDGNQTTIPENHVPKGYKAPAFRMSAVDALSVRKD